MARVLTFVLGVFLGAAVGFGVGITMSPGPDGDDDSPGSAPNAPAAPGSDGTGRDGGRGDRRDDTRAARAKGDPLTAIDVGDLGPVAAGTGAITGHVFDERGRPIAGVRITAGPAGDPPALRRTPTDDDEENLRREIRDMVRDFRWRRALTRSTVTDASGAYRCDGLGDRAWHIGVEKPGWEFSRTEGGELWDEVRPGAEVDVVGAVRHDVVVDVALPSGEPAENAEIITWLTQSPDSTSSQGWSPDDPTLRLRPGEWVLRASSGEHDEFLSDDVKVSIVDGVAAAPVRLALKERIGLIVRVGPAGPDGPTRVSVVLEPEAPGEPTWDHVLPEQSAALLDVAPGNYSLRATNARGQEFHREQVTIGGGLLRRDIAIPAGDLRDWFLVSALAPDGAPAAACSFKVDSDGESESLSEFRLRDGRWKVRLPMAEASPSGAEESSAAKPWNLRVRSEEFGEVELPWEPVPGREYAVQFSAAARLVVTVPDPPEGLGCTLLARVGRAASDRGSDATTREAHNGLATFAPLATGEVNVDLVLRGRDYHQVVLSRTPVALHAGENRIALALPRLHRVRVRVADDVDASDLSLHAERPGEAGDSEYWGDPAVADHVATWDTLPAGRYRLSHSSLGEMRFDVPGPSELTFTAKPWNAIRLNVAEDDAVHRAGLRDGDVAIALDGTEFETPKQIYALIAAGSLKSKSRMTVLRGGQRLEVEIDLAKLDDALRYDLTAR